MILNTALKSLGKSTTTSVTHEYVSNDKVSHS